ncbi:hypothetical protein BX600DRAFT_472203 [Xylariales sp. PMI_506]|nr:hypothetical protein BX600DRAFT_472203 [Xylariales sp. PMI_506]
MNSGIRPPSFQPPTPEGTCRSPAVSVSCRHRAEVMACEHSFPASFPQPSLDNSHGYHLRG